VENYDEKKGTGTGFMFDQLNPSAIYNTVGWAVSTWYDRFEHIKAMRLRAMKQNFSWENSATQYVELYEKTLAR